MQQDLFATTQPARVAPTAERAPLDMPGLLERLTSSCQRPSYNFMLLTLIVKASADTGEAGPYVRSGSGQVGIRDWLCDAMNPLGRRDPRRLRLAAKVREELSVAGSLPCTVDDAEQMVDDEVRRRLRQSGRTNVSRAVSELVRAGLIGRYYQGDYVDHHNRGGQRHAVYTVTEETRRALAPQG